MATGGVVLNGERERCCGRFAADAIRRPVLIPSMTTLLDVSVSWGDKPDLGPLRAATSTNADQPGAAEQRA